VSVCGTQAAETELLERTKDGTVAPVTIVNLSMQLVTAKSTSYVERGVFKLTELLRETGSLERELGLCALYHLALGHYKLGDERTALGEVTSLLNSKSFHTSALALKQICINKMISKQKSSGLLSRLMRKKEDNSSQVFQPTNLAFLTPEEETERTNQDEADRAVLATMFASPSSEQQEIDEEEMIRTIIAEDNMRKYGTSSPNFDTNGIGDPSFTRFDSPPPPSSSSSGISAPSSTSFSSTQSLLSNNGLPSQRDSYLSDTVENGAMRASLPVESSASSSLAPGLAGSALSGAPAGQRSSAWVRSKPGKEPAENGFQAAARSKPHDSLPTSLIRKTRPLRASQSQRSAPSAKYMAQITTLSNQIASTDSASDNYGSDDEDYDEDDGYDDLEEETSVEVMPPFVYRSYSPNPEISRVEAELASLQTNHTIHEEELQQRIKMSIATCQQDYQLLLQVHQAAQYELLRVQQEAVTQLQNDQLAALEEERSFVALPLEQQDPEVSMRLQTRMKELTDKQGPLLDQQQQDQLKMVDDQQAEQKARQEAFKTVLLAHNQEKAEMKARFAQEAITLPEKLAVLKQADIETYLQRKIEAEQVYTSSWEKEQAKAKAQREIEREARRVQREARRVERERLRQEEEKEKQRLIRVEQERVRIVEEEATRLRVEFERQQALLLQEQELQRQRQRLQEEARKIQEDASRREQQLRQEALLTEQKQVEESLRAQQEAMLLQQHEMARQQAILHVQQEEEFKRQQELFEMERLRLVAEQEAVQRSVMEQENARLAAYLEAQRKAFEIEQLQFQQQQELQKMQFEQQKQELLQQQAQHEAQRSVSPTTQPPGQPPPSQLPKLPPTSQLPKQPQTGTVKTAASGSLKFAKPAPPSSGPPAAVPASVKIPKSTGSANIASNPPAKQPPQQPQGAGAAPAAKRTFGPPPSSDLPPQPADTDVIDVFAITKGLMRTPVVGGPPPTSGKLALASVSGISTPPPLGLAPSGPPLTGPTSTAMVGAAPTSNKLPRPAGGLPTVPPSSVLPPSTLPSTGPPPSGLPSVPPPSGPPSATLPPLPNGPPPSGKLPALPPGPPPDRPLSGTFEATSTSTPGARPAPPAARPLPPATVTTNLQAFSEKQQYARPAPPMPTIAKGPPAARIPQPSGAPAGPPSAVPSSYGAPPPMPTVSKSGPPPTPAVGQQPPKQDFSSPPAAGFYGSAPSAAAPGGDGQDLEGRGISSQELKTATSNDITKGVSKDKYGLPVSKTTTKGAHLLGAASKAKGPSRRPPSQAPR
jgi:hypothetical protein